MKISFDMQAFQSVNRIGGIGKYNFDFLNTLFQLYPNNEYTLVYNGRDTEGSTEGMRRLKSTRSRIINYLPGNDLNPINKWIQFFNYRFYSSDIIHILSPFEPQSHTVILNKPVSTKTVITIYDFIPLIFRELYLSSSGAQKLYSERTKIMKYADLMLSISEATRRDAINLFNIAPEKVVNIGLAASDDYFKMDDTSFDLILEVKKRLRIDGNFILTVSNLDHRKNLLKLLRAFSSLPNYLLEEYSLVVITNSTPEYIRNNREITELMNGQGKTKIKFLHNISNEELCSLYNCCNLFVYASLYEGGGLPVLEAMKCGAPVIASNTSSIPEYIGRTDNLFNPHDMNDIANSMENILTNDSFRHEIAEHGLGFSKNITWNNVVQRAIMAYEHILHL